MSDEWNQGSVEYSPRFNCFVIVHPPAIDPETAQLCRPVEWDWSDLMKVQRATSLMDEPYEVGEFVFVGRL